MLSLRDFFKFLFQKKMDINPWQVDNIQEFYILKCPECDFMHKEENYFQNHALANHPLSVTFFNDVDMTIEKIGIFDDCNEENEPNDTLNTVKEEILETRNDHEIDIQIFSNENEVKNDDVYDVTSSETVNDICPEIHEFQDSEEPQLSEISQVTDITEVQEPPTIIPLLTYEYAAAQIAHAIPARESREISNEDPTINADRLDFSQQILNQPSSSNLTSPSIVNRKRNNKPAKCSICDASFTRKANLNLHIASVHEGKKQSFICSICDSSFTQSKNLRAHVATVHEGRKTRKCSICNKRFAYSRDLKRHIARIHKEV